MPDELTPYTYQEVERERVLRMEMSLAKLRINNAHLRKSLREILAMVQHASERGTAAWYQRALRALEMRNDDAERASEPEPVGGVAGGVGEPPQDPA